MSSFPSPPKVCFYFEAFVNAEKEQFATGFLLGTPGSNIKVNMIYLQEKEQVWESFERCVHGGVSKDISVWIPAVINKSMYNQQSNRD